MRGNHQQTQSQKNSRHQSAEPQALRVFGNGPKHEQLGGGHDRGDEQLQGCTTGKGGPRPPCRGAPPEAVQRFRLPLCWRGGVGPRCTETPDLPPGVEGSAANPEAESALPPLKRNNAGRSAAACRVNVPDPPRNDTDRG